ncbi:MAG: UDP-N-acetylmuramate-L-alanine ligase [uncultured bacterium]|nr:MAG: UDP-N-acetylmuramate-L-alanine ligase [uncultured bacterium]
MKYHFIGINGVSMSGLANLIAELGHEVSGCDINKLKTENEKLKIIVGHNISHITKDLDGVVVTCAALHPSSPAKEEIEQAKKMGVKIIKRSQLIGLLMSPNNQISKINQMGIAVAGMHGKTTTSSMIAHILTYAKYDPTILVGGEVRNIGASEKLGKGKYLVAEACEYERQFLDFRPKIAVITNIEEEHLDTYTGGIKDIKQTFKKFIKLLPKDGLLVLNQDDKNCMSLMKVAKCKVKRVTIKKPWPGLKLQMPGKHILLDATLAARVAHEIGIDSKTIKDALNSFIGTKRRFEVKGMKDGVTVVDDYGHHPTEIQATILAAREQLKKFQISNTKFSLDKLETPVGQINSKSKIPNPKINLKSKILNHKLVVVFQPHQYTRTKLLFKDFVKSFDGADKVIISDIYLIAGREPAEARADYSRDLVEAIKKHCNSKSSVCHSELVSESKNPLLSEESQCDKCDIKYISRYKDILSELKKTAQKGDLVMTLGATDIYKVGEEFLK